MLLRNAPFLLALVLAVLAGIALAQRADSYDLSDVTWIRTEIVPTADGGVAVIGCASVSSADGGATLANCSAPYPAPTAAKRASWQTAADIGLRVWLRDSRLNPVAVP